MRLSWVRAAIIATVAAFFAGLALDLTAPLVAMIVMALVDRVLVSLFMSEQGIAGEGEQAA